MTKLRWIAAAALALSIAGPGAAQEKQVTQTTENVDEGMDLPPLPADKTVKQSAVIGGRTISYNATVGTIPVKSAAGPCGGRPRISLGPASGVF